MILAEAKGFSDVAKKLGGDVIRAKKFHTFKCADFQSCFNRKGCMNWKSGWCELRENRKCLFGNEGKRG